MQPTHLLGPRPPHTGTASHPDPQPSFELRSVVGSVGVSVPVNRTWDEIVGSFPGGRRPDFLALWLGTHPIPEGLWRCGLPVVGLAHDWNLLWHALRHRLPLCDLVLTDATGVDALQRAGYRHARPAQLYGLGPDFPIDQPGDAERDIDVLFVGNFNPAVQRQRNPWLARLARLADRYRVVVRRDVYGAEYRRLLGRAKVVFNRSIRGEVNQRTFEAVAAGCLLIQEAGNREVARLLEPGREYVAYSDDDLEGLLERHLADDRLRAGVVAAARAKLAGFTFEAFWADALQTVEREWDGLKSPAQARRAVPWQLRVLERLESGPADGDERLCRDLREVAERSPRDTEPLVALGVLAGSAAEAEALFAEALSREPGDPLAGLNRVEALLELGRNADAEGQARSSLASLERDEGHPAYSGDPWHYPFGYDRLRVEWERAGWANAGDPAAERSAKRDLLRWRLHARLASLTGSVSHYYEQAVARPDIPEARAALGCALAREGRVAEAVPHLSRAVADQPFDAAAARALYQALGEAGESERQSELARDRRLLAEAVPQLVSPEPWFAETVPDRLTAPPLRIDWDGDHTSLASLALVNRELCRVLARRGYRITTGGAAADVTVRHRWPPDWSPPFSGHWVTMQPWEFGSLPESWVGPLRDMVDEAWVPSTWVRRCFVESGVPADRVHVIPLGVDPQRFRPGVEPLTLATAKRFKFLFVGGTIWRKGFDLLLRAYGEEFTDRDDVCLVVKDMGGGSFYRGQTAGAAIEEFRRRAGAPEVESIDRDLSAAEMAGLYAACDCLAHPYRGEGFGLPVAEAMACGLPVIVTVGGAADDFCRPEFSLGVPARVVRFDDQRVDDMPTVGLPWVLEPDVDELRRLMRAVVDDPGAARDTGAAASEFIRREFTWEKAADAVERRLAEIRERVGRSRTRQSLDHRPKSGDFGYAGAVRLRNG